MNKEKRRARKTAKYNKHRKHYTLMLNHKKRSDKMTRTQEKVFFKFGKLMAKNKRELSQAKEKETGVTMQA